MSAKWMSKDHLNILRYMDKIYGESLVTEDPIWTINFIGPSSLSDELWNLLSRYHNNAVGHAKGDKLQKIISVLEDTEVSLADCNNFTSYCSHCQKESMSRFLPARVSIDKQLMNLVMIDIYSVTDTDPEPERADKIEVLTIVDCTSRVLQLVRVGGMTPEDIVIGLLKAAVLMPFTEAVFSSDRGTHFLAACNELLQKLVANKYRMSYAGSHQSQGLLEVIHREVNKYLRPLLDVLYKVIDNNDAHQYMDAGIAMAGGIYNRMPHSALGMNSPLQVWTPLAEVNVRLFKGQDTDDDFGHEALDILYAIYLELWDMAMIVSAKVNKEYVDAEARVRVFNFEVGDLCLVAWDPVAGKPHKNKLHCRNHGPYQITGFDGDFYHIETITGFDRRMDIHSSRITPFRWDPRCIRTAIQVANDAQRSSIVISIDSWKLVPPSRRFRSFRDRVRFTVTYEDGPYESIEYETMKDNTVFLRWLAHSDRLAFRTSMGMNLRRLRDRGAVDAVFPEVQILWKPTHPDLYLEDGQGIAPGDLDPSTKDIMADDFVNANILVKDPRQRREMFNLIKEFGDIFGKVEPGHFIKGEDIKFAMKDPDVIKDMVLFKRSPPIRNEKMSGSMDKVLEMLLETGRIEEIAEGEEVLYNTPTFLKAESDKDRFLTNSVHINNLYKHRKFPMSYTVEDIHYNLKNKNYISSIDAQMSFYLYRVSKEYRNLTAFTDPRNGKRYRFLCLTMGMSDSPCIMQERMEQYFPQEMPYIDDISYGDYDWKSHMEHTRKIFQQCRDIGMKLKFSKCVFGSTTGIVSLGRYTNAEYRQIDDKTSERLRNMKRPDRISSLISSLAKMNWIRGYVNHYGQIAQPLYAITSTLNAKKKIFWNDMPLPTTRVLESSVVGDALVWKALTEACSNPSKLYFLDEKKRIYGCSDASKEGYGFVIFQLENEELEWHDPDQVQRYIAICSGSFGKDQRAWTTTEQECFAFYKGIMSNKHLLLGRRFILITDHLNLTYLVDSESMKVIRWKLGLQQFEMDYVHGQGVLIPVPDHLSRL